MSKQFAPTNQLADNKPIRSIAWHPDGKVYAFGTNSRKIKICCYPDEQEFKRFRDDELLSKTTSFPDEIEEAYNSAPEPQVIWQFLHVHRGSVFCLAFNKKGSILASGSNDHDIHLIQFNATEHVPQGSEYKLSMHSGTVRQVMFLNSNQSEETTLVSAGAGDNAVYLSDCNSMKPKTRLSGHEAPVMALSQWEDQFVFSSAGLDGTIRFWDTRMKQQTFKVNVNKYNAATVPFKNHFSDINKDTQIIGQKPDESKYSIKICSMDVESDGKLLVCGFNDGKYMLFDMRSRKPIQINKVHYGEIRAMSISAKSYYLLTGSYDGRLVLSDLQGNLEYKLPSVCIADFTKTNDKFINASWHPQDQTFISTTLNGAATLWSTAFGLHCGSMDFSTYFGDSFL